MKTEISFWGTEGGWTQIWASENGFFCSDDVTWGVRAGALGDGDTIDTALGTSVTVNDVLLADNGTELQITEATAALTVGGTPALNDVLIFEIFRNVGGTDDMPEDAWLFGIKIQYLENQEVAEW